jgi:hypothetical protein
MTLRVVIRRLEMGFHIGLHQFRQYYTGSILSSVATLVVPSPGHELRQQATKDSGICEGE